MPATLAQDIDLPIEQVALGAASAIRQMGFDLIEAEPGGSSRTLSFEIPGTAVPSVYIVEIKQTVPSASRIFVSGSTPQICQRTLDQIQSMLAA